MSARAPASADLATWARELRPAAHHLRVWVANADGTLIDLTTLCDMDFVLGATVREGQDQPVGTATVRLRRQHGRITLAPGRRSAANVDDSGAVADLLDVRREIVLEAQWQPPGEPSDADGDWWEFFRGRIDTIRASSSSEEITLECRDRGGELLDLFLWQETVYSTATGEPLEDVLQELVDDACSNYQIGGLLAWTTATVFAAGDYVRPTVRNGWLYSTAAGGTTGGTEPTWPTTVGATVIDGTVTWTCAGWLPTVTLYAGSPGWTVRYYVQQRQPLLTALAALAQQAGWDVRVDWVNATDTWELVLQRPDRTTGMAPEYVQSFLAAYPDYAAALSMEPWREVERSLERSIADVRNVVTVVWTDADGRHATTAENAASIAAYGRRYLELSEASTSNIDTQAEAEALRDNALADLKEPRNRWSLTLPLFLGARLFDAWSMVADDNLVEVSGSTGVLSAAITGFEHVIEGGRAETTLRMVQGAVTGLRRTWLGREVRPGVAPSSQGLADQGNWAFRAYPSADPAATISATWTTLTLDATTYDLGGVVAAGAFNVPRTGSYLLAAMATFKTVPFGQHCYVRLMRQPAGDPPPAAVELARWSLQATVDGTADVPVQGSLTAWLLAGDVVYMQVSHDNASDLDVGGGSALTNLAGKRMR